MNYQSISFICHWETSHGMKHAISTASILLSPPIHIKQSNSSISGLLNGDSEIHSMNFVALNTQGHQRQTLLILNFLFPILLPLIFITNLEEKNIQREIYLP